MNLEDLRALLEPVLANVYWRALLLFLTFLAGAKIFDWIVTRILKRLTHKTTTHLDDQIIHLLHRPIFVSLTLVGFASSLTLLTEGPLQSAIWRVSLTIVVLLWTVVLLKLAHLILSSMSRQRRFEMVQPATLPLFDIGAKLVMIGGSALILLSVWSLNLSAWVASAGVAGLALGLAAQETLSNLFAGLSILSDAPYKVGDFIVLDSGERGQVTRIGLRSTRILTRDEIEVSVPNSQIANSRISNENAGPLRQRMRIPFGVAYGADADQVKALITKLAKNHPAVADEPEAWVQFRQFGDSSLNFELRCWIHDPAKRGRTLDALNSEIYKTLSQEGIEIPFPKRDLYIKELPHQSEIPPSGISNGKNG